MNAGRLLDAFQTLTQSIQEFPAEDLLYRKRAVIAYLLNAYELAWRDLEYYVATNPADGIGWYNRARVALALDEPSVALECYRRARDAGYSEPDISNVITQLVLHCEGLQSDLQAVEQFLKGNNDSLAHHDHVAILLNLGRFDDAYKAVQDWLASDTSAKTRFMLGSVELRRGQYERALSVFQDLERSGDIIPATVGKAKAYCCLGKWREAREALDFLIKQNEAGPDARRLSATIALALGDTDRYESEMAFVERR